MAISENRKFAFTRPEFEIIEKITFAVRYELEKRLVAQFGDEAAGAMGVSLALLFASSMVDDNVAQQESQAALLNRFLEKWRKPPMPYWLRRIPQDGQHLTTVVRAMKPRRKGR